MSQCTGIDYNVSFEKAVWQIFSSAVAYLLSANSVRISYFYFVQLIVLFPVFLYAASWRNKR